jgi:hypothetical protein
LAVKDNLIDLLTISQALGDGIPQAGKEIKGAFRLCDVTGNQMTRDNNVILGDHVIFGSNFLDLPGTDKAALVMAKSAVIVGNSSPSLKNILRYALPGGAGATLLRKDLNLLDVLPSGACA